MGRGKELKLNIKENYNIFTGTVDGKNPKTIYLVICGWAELNNMFHIPESGEPTKAINFSHIISKLTNDTKKLVNSKRLDTFKENRTIVDLDMRYSGMGMNKRTYFNCEITLFQNDLEQLPLSHPKLQSDINELSNTLLSEVFESNEDFIFHKTKK